MDTMRQRLSLVNRGDLIQTAEGFVIADTWASDPGVPEFEAAPVQFWYDTDSGKHYGTDDLLTVAVPTFRTREYGNSRSDMGHVLLNYVPRERPRGLCSGSRNADLAVWSSGTALTGVNCPECRKMIRLLAGIKR